LSAKTYYVFAQHSSYSTILPFTIVNKVTKHLAWVFTIRRNSRYHTDTVRS